MPKSANCYYSIRYQPSWTPSFYPDYLTDGRIILNWNITNYHGNAVQNGIYFLNLTGAGIDESYKVEVMKE